MRTLLGLSSVGDDAPGLPLVFSWIYTDHCFIKTNRRNRSRIVKFGNEPKPEHKNNGVRANPA